MINPSTKPPSEETQPSYEDLKTLGLKEWIAALALLNLLFLAAWLAPQGVGQSPSGPATFGKVVPAPWIFLAVQWLLFYLHPFLGGMVPPLASLALLLALPFLPDKRTLIRTLFLILLFLWLSASLWAFLRLYFSAG